MSDWKKSTLNPPGLVGDVVAWIREASGMDQPKFALAAGLTTCGALLGRGVKDYTGQRTNLYTLAVGYTSAGKNAPIQAIQAIMSAMLRDRLLAGKVTSDTALEILLAAYPVRLFLLDEIGHYITSLRTAGASNGHLKTVMPALTECWSCAASAYVGKARAADSNGKWKPPRIIQEPCACLYGTTAPGVLFDGMSEADFTDGSIPRFLAFISETRPEYVAKPAMAFPDDLKNALNAALLRLGISAPKGDDADGGAVAVPVARVIDETRDAADVFEAMEELKHAKLTEADRGDNALYLWGKAVENARRIALTVAALRRPKSPRVEKIDAEYSAGLVVTLVNDMVGYVRENVATTKAERVARDIVRFIKRNGGKIDRGELTRLTQKYTRDERADAIDDLLDARQIEIVPTRGTGAKNITVYRLAPAAG